jgi:hypothetical protein
MKMMKKKKYYPGGRVKRPQPKAVLLLSDSEKEERRIKKLKQLQKMRDRNLSKPMKSAPPRVRRKAEKGKKRNALVNAMGMLTSAGVGRGVAKGFNKLKQIKDDFKEDRSSGGRNKKQKPTPKTITLNKGGKVMKYNMGGKVMDYAGMPMMADGGMVKKKKKKVSKKKSIDGIARRGRTKGRMV